MVLIGSVLRSWKAHLFDVSKIEELYLITLVFTNMHMLTFLVIIALRMKRTDSAFSRH